MLEHHESEADCCGTHERRVKGASSRRIFSIIYNGKEELVGEPFHRLIKERELIGYSYNGFWASMDTFKNKQYLDGLYAGGVAPWEVRKVNGR